MFSHVVCLFLVLQLGLGRTGADGMVVENWKDSATPIVVKALRRRAQTVTAGANHTAVLLQVRGVRVLACPFAAVLSFAHPTPLRLAA